MELYNGSDGTEQLCLLRYMTLFAYELADRPGRLYMLFAQVKIASHVRFRVARCKICVVWLIIK